METKIFYTCEGENVSDESELLMKLKADDMYTSFIENHMVKMVGSYMFSDRSIWYSFPKYYKLTLTDGKPSHEDMLNLKQIVQVIEKLRNAGKNLFEGNCTFAPYEVQNLSRKINLIDLATYLVKDYIVNGLYVRRVNECYQGTIGKTTWGKTVSKCIPVISNNDIVYDYPWKKKQFDDNNNLITEIHSLVIGQALELYEKYNGRSGIECPNIMMNIVENQIQAYSKLLKQELLSIFSDRETNLIKALIAWIDLSQNYKLAGCTNCFQNVWEWVNDAVFGNQASATEKESGNPVYSFVDKNGVYEEYLGRGTAKPDTIFFEEKPDSNQYYLYVYDAKYYIPNINVKRKEVYGYPANSDVVKQIAYLERITDSFTPIKEQLIRKNIFLLPEIGEINMEMIGQELQHDNLFTEIGFVVKANFDSMAMNLMKKVGIKPEEGDPRVEEEAGKVYLYSVNCKNLFNAYLNDFTYRPTE